MSSHDHEVAICKHGLRYDPSQTAGCVICRREAEGVAVASGPQLPVVPARSFGRVVGALLAVAVLVALAAFAVPAWLDSGDRGPPPGRAVQTRSVAPSAPGGDARRAGSPRGQAAVEPVRSQHGASTPGIEAEEAPPRMDPRARQRIEAEALARARSNVRVVVYTTSWCPHCARAKAFMDSAGIHYTERDIEASEVDASNLERINPRLSVPTFDVEGEVLTGFSPQGLVDAIDRVARRGL